MRVMHYTQEICLTAIKAERWSQQFRGPIGYWVYYGGRAVCKGRTTRRNRWAIIKDEGIPSLHQGLHLIYVHVRADKCCSASETASHRTSNDSAVRTWLNQRQFHNSPTVTIEMAPYFVCWRGCEGLMLSEEKQRQHYMLLIYCTYKRNVERCKQQLSGTALGENEYRMRLRVMWRRDDDMKGC